MQRHFVLAASLATLALGVTAPAQNLIKNGDFSGATIAPWKAANYALKPGLTRYDVDGTGPSACYGVTPGGRTANPPFPVHILSQTVTVLPLEYELSLDLTRVGTSLSVIGSRTSVSVKLGTQTLQKFSFKISRRTVLRERICLNFRPPRAGNTTISLHFENTSLASTRSRRFYVDNVMLRVAAQPTFCIRGDRFLGGTTQFTLAGSASSTTVLFLAPKLLARPIPIPGWTGSLALDPSSLGLFFVAPLDASGQFATRLSIPNIPSIAGVPIYWQGVQVSTTGKSIGWPSKQSFYR